MVYSWMLCLAYNLESNKEEITMTENEAIKWQEAFKKTYGGYPKDSAEACDMAISAIKEAQQYRSSRSWI